MDERALFERFHEALDMEPRPGAFERLRTQLTSSKPVALTSRPRFQMRFTRMGLRMAAALTAVLIAIALIATFIAVHNRPVGQIPAHADANLTAYRAMIDRDYSSFVASTSNHCATIQDTGCAAATVPVIQSMQKWIEDMKAFHTPAQLVALDAVFRDHLQAAIDDLSAAVSFQKASDEAGFNLAVNAALFERAWIDPADSGLEGTYPGVGNSYRDAVTLAKQSVSGCLSSTPAASAFSCHRLQAYESCAAAQAVQCEGDIQNVGITLETILVGMAEHPAPSTSATQSARVQTDLVHVDAALLAVHKAVLTGDSSAVNTAEAAFQAAMTTTEIDLSAVN
jgi:hypothetical protein